MKAAICTRYGPPEVVELREVPRPEPGPDEILIRVHATTVNSGDRRVRGFDIPAGYAPLMMLGLGLRGPRKKILGMECAGTVAATGAEVTRFSPGDAVFCGEDWGAHAEYRTVRESGPVAKIPPGLGFNEAAALCFGGATALHFLIDRAGLKAGETLLVNGASGAVGVAAIQVAKNAGADVTAVCSAANADLVRGLGADRVIDYREVDFAAEGRRYDVILDAVGTAPWRRSRAALAPRGRLAILAGSLWEALQAPLVSRRGGRRIIAGTAICDRQMVERIAALAAAGALRPVIDRVYPFERIVEAHAHADSGHKRGSIVLHLVD